MLRTQGPGEEARLLGEQGLARTGALSSSQTTYRSPTLVNERLTKMDLQ